MATSKVNNRDLVEILKNSGTIIKQELRIENPYMIVEYCGKTFRINNCYSSKARAYEVKPNEKRNEAFIPIKEI